MAARFAEMQRSGHPWLVAEIDGAVVGYAYAGPYRERPAYRFAVQDAIYLRADMRGRGIGKRLLAALIAEAERCGFRQMIGIVGDSANHASVRLHLTLGFEQVGILGSVGWKHERWLDTVFTQLPLGKAAKEPPDS
jgi:phosphinothricin acetyltransferase